jgi:hypothetical protein
VFWFALIFFVVEITETTKQHGTTSMKIFLESITFNSVQENWFINNEIIFKENPNDIYFFLLIIISQKFC